MKSIVFLFVSFHISAQSEFQQQLEGCWTYHMTINMAKTDTLSFEDVNINWPDFNFIGNSEYIHGTEKGTWTYSKVKQELTLYKSEHDESDILMAEYLNKPIKEASKSVYSDFHLEKKRLYFSVENEVDPDAYYLVFKKRNCEQ